MSTLSVITKAALIGLENQAAAQLYVDLDAAETAADIIAALEAYDQATAQPS